MTDAAFTDDDRRHMARALALAERGLYTATPHPRVGCVIVRDGRALGEGWHRRAGEAHAEVAALDDARARGHDVRGATLYVTLEPCNRHGRVPPCVDAVLDAGVARVVAAMHDPNPAQAAGAERLRMTRGTPWVRAKIAASLDGRTALSGGESRWITGAAARADGHAWRARACAVLTGIGTVLHDDPQLTVRDVATTRQPLRVVVDRLAETPAAARVLADAHALLIPAGARNAAWPASVEALAIPDGSGRVDLAAMMRELARRGLNEVHVEAGAKLNGALLQAGLIDELVVYVAGAIIGDPARGMFELPAPLASLRDRIDVAFTAADRIGDDLRIVARVRAADATARTA